MKPRKGYVQTLFERRTGQTLTEWLLENGPSMTQAEAMQAIGYSGHNQLKDYVNRHLPPDFAFHKRALLFTQDEIKAAIARRENGESWPSIALSYKRDVLQLKDGCRRYLKKLRRASK